MKVKLFAACVALVLCLTVGAQAQQINALGNTGASYNITKATADKPNTVIGIELPRTLLATDRDVVISQRNFNSIDKKVPEETHQFAKFLYTNPGVKSFGISFREIAITLYNDTDPAEFLKVLEKEMDNWLKKVK
jgi:hypothetical protein